jgi:hypothetical protein
VSDIFDETEESLRADQWVTIVKKSWPWVAGVLGLALVIALSIWGYTSWQQSIAAKASDTYQAAVDSVVKGDKAVAKSKFEETVKLGNATYKAFALMQLAGLAVDDKKTDEAIKDLDEAAKASSSPLVSDTAALKAAYLAMDKATFADMQKRLTPLVKDGRPLVPLAKEAMAMAKLQSGDVKGARADLQILSVTLGTPDGIRQRAQSYVQAIDSGAIPTAAALMKEPEASLPAAPAGLAGPQAMPAQ